MLAALNDERNPAMAERIEALHSEGQRLFVAVGALHMTGPKALPALLGRAALRSSGCDFPVSRRIGLERKQPETGMADTSQNFTKLVPGFDFLQGLVKNAGSALPSIGQWVAPTLNPEELEKRIEELRTVQFWLEQNARMLAATIQALEVQRMTLSTLKTMNVPLTALRDSLKVPEPDAPAAGCGRPPKKTAGARRAASHRPPRPRRRRSIRCNGGAR